MADSEKDRGLLDLLKDGANHNSDPIYEQTLGFLLEQGFEEPDFTDFENKIDRLYTLADPNGQNHIGKSYAFLLRADIKDCKFAINKKEGFEDIAYGLLATDEIRDHESSDEAARMQEEFRGLTNEGKIKVYSGLDAVCALVKIMDIRNAIAKAESEGFYERAEHLMCSIYLGDS